MNAEQVQSKLRSALTAAEFNESSASPDIAWKVFQTTCANGINEEGDGVLVQWGTYDLTGPELFSLDFTRQFSKPDDDEFVQLHLTLYHEPNATTKALKSGNKWSFDFATFAEFVAAVEAIPQIAKAMTLSGYRAEVSIDET